MKCNPRVGTKDNPRVGIKEDPRVGSFFVKGRGANGVCELFIISLL